MERRIKHIIFTFILVFISVSILIETTGWQVYKFKELGGFATEYKKPKFTIGTWFSGEFQDSMTLFKDNNTFLRSPLIRVYNEINFQLFTLTKAPEIVIGKNNQCFQEDYIREYTGEYYLGEKLIRERCNRLKYLQDTLNTLGIDFIVVFAPGKASYMPENIPNHLLKNKQEKTNYKSYLSIFDEMQINHLDLQKFFNSIKDTVSWPLFPTYGIHWSDYGMYLALDVFLDEIRNITEKKIPELRLSHIETTNIPQEQDNDLAVTMNLWFNPKETTLAYPKFSNTDTIKPELDVLFIGDSFLFHWFKFDFGTYLFKKYNFWYYNNFVYPEFYSNEVYNYQLNLADEITSRDLIVLECTERFLYTAFWTFEEKIYSIFNPEYQPDPLIYHLNDLTKDRKRFLEIFVEAQNTGKTLEELLYQKATELAVLYIPGTVEFYEWKIRSDPEWIEKIKIQAKNDGLSLDEMIYRNAVWMVEHGN